MLIACSPHDRIKLVQNRGLTSLDKLPSVSPSRFCKHFSASRLQVEIGSKRLCTARVSLALGLGSNNGPAFPNFQPMTASEGASPVTSASTSAPSPPAAATDVKPEKSFQSIDPSASGEDIFVIHSPEEWAAFKSANADKIICLMCKALGCRPCKMFARKYQRVAASNKDSVFVEVTGDESTQLRKLMIELGIRATPTFKFFSEGECILTHTGIDEAKLRASLQKCRDIKAGNVPESDGLSNCMQ